MHLRKPRLSDPYTTQQMLRKPFAYEDEMNVFVLYRYKGILGQV